MALTGGLNMQIEHHCLPRLNSWHYPRIQSEVRKVCEKVDGKERCFCCSDNSVSTESATSIFQHCGRI